MKTFTIYKTILTCFFLTLTTLLSAQCPFTANVTVVNAGGCGNTSGKVFFTATPDTPGSITGIYYLVYKADGTTLVTSSTNTNPEVSTLPAGDYFAEVRVQCTSGTQAPWRKAFTVKASTGNNDFRGVFDASARSRMTTLNAYPSGRLSYNFSGGSSTYTLDIVDYPAEYVGPLHFENIPEGYFAIDELAEGQYSVRMTNGCMVMTDGPRVIKKTEIDIPADNDSDSPSSIIRPTLNTQGGGIPSDRPTTDYYSIHFSWGSTAKPEDFWNSTFVSEFYEYAVIVEGEDVINAQTVWKDMEHSSYQRVDCKYTIGQMANDRNKIPTLYVRLKKTNLIKKQKLIFSNWTAPLYVAPSTTSCGNADFTLSIRNRGTLTYPLDVVIRNFKGSKELRKYTITEADMKASSDFIKLSGIDISEGYDVVFIPTGDPVESHEYSAHRKQGSLSDMVTVHGRRLNAAGSYCEADWGNAYLSSELDLRGTTVTYVGDMPLPEGMIGQFTIPTEAEGNSKPTSGIMYISGDVGSKPWVSAGNMHKTMPAGNYTWEFSIPCGGGYTKFTKTYICQEPSKAIFNGTNYSPKMSSASACGEASIELGKYEDLRKLFSINGYTNLRPSFALCKKSSSGSYGNTYSAIYAGNGVYYPGSTTGQGYCYTAIAANASITEPKIRITRPGTYYLVATASESQTTYIDHGSCFDVREFVITEADLSSSVDETKTGAYFCAQDKSTGIIFVHRKGEKIAGLDYTFKIWNENGSFDKTEETDKLNVTFDNIDVATHGTKFFISVFAEGGCTSTEYSYEVNLNEINNSATFVTQNVSSDCSGTIELDIEATAHEYTSYKWMDVTGRELSATNKVSGRFPAGTKLLLEVQFNATAPGGAANSCGVWTKEYIVDGEFLVEYHWNSNATSADWNNRQNWRSKTGGTALSLPGECAHVHIPATVTSYYPDLNSSHPTSVISHISFATGAQLYGQHWLDYKYAFVNYDFGYYSDLPTPAPSGVVQPDKSIYQKTGSSTSTIPVANLPILKRARWYNLASPLKGMYFSDFQLGGKPYVTEKILEKVTPSPELLVKGNYFATADNFEVSEWYNTITVWVPPYNDAIGADDQSVLQKLDGNISYPYFYPYILNDEIINVRPDLTYDRTSRKMEVADIDMATLALSDEETITRHEKSGRFIYEEVGTNEIGPSGYKLDVSTNTTNGWVRVGNPFMAPIDFDKFITDNPALEAKYLLESDGQTLEYNVSGGTNTVDKYIAPQQSFIVVLKNPSANATVTFTLNAIAVQNATTVKVKIK